jgi:SAM-dependent methyltransferase
MVDHLSEAVIDLYRRHAAQWDADRRRPPWNDHVWHETFIRQLARGSRILDLGCGGAEPVARFLVDHGMHVTGVDSSPAMIALARGRLPEQEWIVADMRRLSLNRRFEGILAWDSYFHLAHEAQRAMFSVFDAHASDDAILMFNTGPEHGEAASTFTFKGEQLYHASLAPLEYRALFDRNGFEVVHYIANDVRSAGRTVWLCRRKLNL